MRRKRLLWQLFPSYLFIVVISLFAVTFLSAQYLRNFYYTQIESDLISRARMLEDRFAKKLAAGEMETIDAKCKELGGKADIRITVVLPDGKVVGDSEESPEKMDNHADRPEIKKALDGHTGSSVRYSRTLRKNMMYVAVPAKDGAEIAGVVRTSIPVTSIDRALWTVQARIAVAGLIIAMLAAAIGFFVSRKISRPLEELKRGAERYAGGDLGVKLEIPDSEEIGSLAEAMNEMAAQLDERLRTVIRQRNEMDAVLSSMVEGVLAVDPDERIIDMNHAAAGLLGIDGQAAKGRSIQEIVRNTDLQNFIGSAFKSAGTTEGDIIFHDKGERFLQAHGTRLRDSRGGVIGVLIVLNDITRLKRLENIRRDFVANVSHELKTPITNIKGYVETLLGGAMENEDEAKRFLGIVAKNSDRLNSIIDDLLSLSRIEQEAEREKVPMSHEKVKGVLVSAIQGCEAKASEKNIAINLSCADDIEAEINFHLLEQAVANLIDNAVKYSEDGKSVEVEAVRTESETIIRVRDQGRGIPAEHRERIFERFYRVDKSRSRELGGTGLGLAIVKHIAGAHGGHVEVESRPGKGSIFSIHLSSS